MRTLLEDNGVAAYCLNDVIQLVLGIKVRVQRRLNFGECKFKASAQRLTNLWYEVREGFKNLSVCFCIIFLLFISLIAVPMM